MAQHQPGYNDHLSFTNRQKAVPGPISTNPGITDEAAYQSNSALDLELGTLAPTVYAASTLNRMTSNDKAYAVRVLQDPTTI